MFIFISSVNPKGLIKSKIDNLQAQYVEAFNSWSPVFSSENYYYIDNSIDRISDIQNRQLVDLFWDVYDFGAVIPHVILTRDYTNDKITGTFEMFTFIVGLFVKKEIKLNDKYVFFTLGRRKLSSPDEFFSVKINEQDFDYYFINETSRKNMVSDDLFICKADSLIDVDNYLKNYSGNKNYQSFLTDFCSAIPQESKKITNMSILQF